MAEQPKEARLKINRVLQNANLPPKQLNKVHWTRVGSDLQLDFGHYDLPNLRDAINAYQDSKEVQPVNLMVTDRFVISPTTAVDLHNTFSAIVQDLRENNLLPQH